MIKVMTYPFARGKVAPNDHYDGVRFFNPWELHTQSLKNMPRVGREIQRTPWPLWIDIPKHSLPPAQVLSGINYVVINHATALIQTQGLNILTDPVFSERVSPLSWAGPKRVHQPGVSLEDLPKIDVVLISHNHYDHMELDGLKKLEKKFHPLFLTSLGNEIFLQKKGLKKVNEFDWWESLELGNLKFTFTPAQHFSSRGLTDRDRSLWGGFYIESPQHKIFFAGDTGYAPFFTEIRQRLGAPDLSFLPIGAYEPRWFMRVIHMNPEDAVQAHQDLGSKMSVGIHFGCFKLTSEPIDDPATRLGKEMKAKGLVEATFFAPQFGKSYFQA